MISYLCATWQIVWKLIFLHQVDLIFVIEWKTEWEEPESSFKINIDSCASLSFIALLIKIKSVFYMYRSERQLTAKQDSKLLEIYVVIWGILSKVKDDVVFWCAKGTSTVEINCAGMLPINRVLLARINTGEDE